MKKLLNKANPSKENFNEFSIQIEEFKKLFHSQIEGKENHNELVNFIKQLIENQDVDGYWRLIDSNDIPYDAIVEYWKYPTILFTAIMINFQINHPMECAMIEGFDNVLIKALDIVERGKLAGHGYSSFSFMIKALKILAQANVMKFIEVYPYKHEGFTNMIYATKSNLARALEEGKTIHDFNEEFRLRIEEVLNLLDNKQKVYLFVYGTLMKGNRQGQTYLDIEEFKGESILSGYSLYDLGYYPGIVKDIDGRVKGELYLVSKNKLAEIDVYEAEGTLYKRELVKIYSENGGPVEAFVYVYNQSVINWRKVDFNSQPWFKGINQVNKNYVWYACYGSNINKKRFMKYINQCKDQTPPRAEKPFIIKYPIYFSNRSSTWSNKGVCFLDLEKIGASYGKIYLVTEEQFKDIHRAEGSGPNWYNAIVDLGFEDGIPVKTFTHRPRQLEDVIPSTEYLDVIASGIQASYPALSAVEIQAYLMKRYLNSNNLAILSYLRNQAHGVSIQKISNDMGKDKREIISGIHDLIELELIRQDTRSKRRGDNWDSANAIYYTMRDKREIIDKALIIEEMDLL